MLITGLILSGCQPSTEADRPTGETEEKGKVGEIIEQKKTSSAVAMGTYTIGSTGYLVGTGVAKVINDFSSIKVISEPTSGPNAFVPLMETGEFLLGLQTGNDVGWAYSGGTGYNKPYKNIRVLLRGHDVPTIPLVVRVDSGIKSTEELRGKRVAGEYGNSIYFGSCNCWN